MHIEIISAGAGSGKTYTLTNRMVALLQGGVNPAGIFATTFTKKAAAELQERVRLKLLESGMTEAANELGEALIGTVHSIGIKLLQRFAFEAGVSPLVEIIADGDEQRLFNESLSQVLSEDRIDQLNLLADRLGLTKKSFGEPFDWRRDIRTMTEVARANQFSKSILQASKKSSWESFEKLLPPVQHTDQLTWNNRLISSIDQTVAALEANEADSTKTTKDAIETLKSLQNQLKFRGELYWFEWVKIAKTNVGAKSRDLMEPLQQFALSHDEHHLFRSDVKGYLDLVFDIASDALEEYELYKKKRGLIDYTDMETYVSSLLRIPSVRETLRREIGLLLVDEFQDTSPIQLDIFLQLSQLAQHSIWVGDPKQSIYGFRGADPALMKAIVDASGGIKPENILKDSWRSRPDVVYAINAIFERAFPDLTREQIVLNPAFGREKELPGTGPALIHWHFRSELDERRTPGSPWLENCIADQVRIMLERKPIIYNKRRTETRPAKPGDIAILCRNNKGCLAVAEALHRAGLKASISRAGLLETPEVRLALACLKFLVTASDTLSVAEILFLTGAMDLESIANDRLEYLYRQTTEPTQQRWAADNDYVAKLNELRGRTTDLSASEIIEWMFSELDIRRLAVTFGNPNQRLDNLDKLRRFALDYESACKRLHSASTLGGFLLWINDLARNDQDFQGSGESEDAVKVLTYHRSKGLEYPITICHNLEQNLKEQVWGINLVSETTVPDLNNILGNRRLRFWVNPYSDQIGKTGLEEALLQTDAWSNAQQIAREEEARLLYVGLTRARDYLIFPTTPKDTKWLNRVFNRGDESIPTLDPNTTETPFYHLGAPLHCDTQLVYKPKDFPEVPPAETSVLFHDVRKGKSGAQKQPLYIDTTKEMPQGFDSTWGTPLVWGSWLEFKGAYDPELASALKNLFSVDFQQLTSASRVNLVEKQLLFRNLTQQVQVSAVLQQWEAFDRFLQAQAGPGNSIAKFQVEAWHGKRKFRWEPDLCRLTGNKHFYFCFAGFAEGMKKWHALAKSWAPGIAWSRFLHAAEQGPPPSGWVVFPVEGQAVELIF
ncbi:MAG: UvrD-helicase domain-containing protein [Saprospiraceae bacterium]|nr:UvrD-helicase domain-containing protein [Saprospiraceae bacterium]